MSLIFVVDADPGSRESVRGVLVDVGHEASGFKGGSELVAGSNSFRRPDLLVVDAWTLKHDLSLQAWLRRDPGSGVPVVLLDASGQKTALDARASVILRKPLHPELLVSVVASLSGHALLAAGGMR